MMAGIIRWSSQNILIILMATVFAIAAGVYAVIKTPLDAIPDLSDPQVIVYTEYPGQAPQVVEDQVTYPLTTALLAVPRSKVVRGFSFFGASFVYVVFEDGTDGYWARSRVLEYLNFAQKRLPVGITPSLGPDATGVGWVFQYAVVGARKTLAELRTIQDWLIRYQLTKAEGVAEVASVGGFVKQYQVVVDPTRLRAYGIPLSKVTDAIRSSNMDVGGRSIEMSERELPLAHLDRATTDVHVAGADGIGDLGKGNPVGSKPRRIDDDLVLLHEAADAGDFGHALCLGQLITDEPILDRAQFSQRLPGADHGVLKDPTDPGGIGS